MNSNPLDFPNWMEDSQSSRSNSSNGATPSSSDASASQPAPAAPFSSARSTTPPASFTGTGSLSGSSQGSSSNASVPSASSSSPSAPSNGSPSTDALRGLSRIEKERMQIMSQLDGWGRAWAEVEKRNAQCVDELTRHVEGLAQEHAQCEGRRKELEQRATEHAQRSTREIELLRSKIGEIEPFVQQSKELGAKCASLDQELAGAKSALDQSRKECGVQEERARTLSSEMDKLKDHLTRSQEATKEATARELDWQRRYHEDTGKLMQQLTTKSQECERWIGENQKQKGEIDKQTRDLRAKDEIVQTMSLRCSDLEQRSTTLQSTIQEKETRLQELTKELAALQKELADHKAAEEEQSSMLQAAQGVLAELQPKLMQLEKKLAKH